MDFQFIGSPADRLGAVSADALLVVIPAGAKSPLRDKALSAAFGVLQRRGDYERKAGRTIYLHGINGVKAPRVVFSTAKDASPKALRAAATSGLAALKGRSVRHLAVAWAGVPDAGAAHAEMLALGFSDAGYLYRHTKPSAESVPMPRKVSLVADKSQSAELKAGLKQAEAIAAGIELARECANRPANHCTPSYLAQVARDVGKAHGLTVNVLDKKACEKLGMGSFLAVAQGSDEPPQFITMEYRGGPKGTKPVVLVGKGITFDTGGISIKPSAEMDEMKFDMGGAASVLGTMRAVAELKPPINVVGLIPSCENMPSGHAVKPGDVVTSLSGQTIEILNTDAEGRLILCDALTYAERYEPQTVVDIATLTGACVVALGHHNSGLFTPDDDLAAELQAAAGRALDPCWRMPLDDEYDELLKSNFVDMANIGGRAGGAITAAKFLQRYTAKYRWAHLDVAGTAWRSGAAKGATGRPVGLLTHFVLARAAAL
jgi:leucyl aminopeptidase